MKWRFVASKTLGGKCPQESQMHTSFQGSIESRGYPYKYQRHQLCIHHIKVPKGYKIKMNFDGFKLGKRNLQQSACLKTDHMVLSTKLLHFQDIINLSNKYQLLLCGAKKPKRPVITQGNHLWIRFYADGQQQSGEEGYRITYTAIDKNECTQKIRPCEQVCVNTRGSYFCKCNTGFRLKEDGKNCEVITMVRFSRSEYNVKLQRLAVGETVITLSATVETVNGKTLSTKPRFIIPDSNIRKFLQVDNSGILSFKLVPPETFQTFRVIVKAYAQSAMTDQCTVVISVDRKNELDKEFTILLQQGVQVNQEIFFLKPHYHTNNAYSFFSMDTQYFDVKEKSGKVFIKSKLPGSSNANVMWRTRTTVKVKVVDELGIESNGKSVLNIILLPVFPGEEYVTPEILEQVMKQLENDRSYTPQLQNNVDLKITFQTVGLHRLLRQLSAKAKRISKAKLFFDEVMKTIQKKVEDAYSDPKRGDPVIVHLGTGQILSSRSLEKVVNASHCLEATSIPDCTSFMFGPNYQSFDGTCNNINNPLWGAASIAFKRHLPALYYDADGLADPIGFPNLPEAPIIPSAHRISQEFFKVHKNIWQSTSRRLAYSHMLMQWGQFLDHDITMTAESEGGHRCVFPRCLNGVDDYINPCFPMMYPGKDQGCTMFVRSAAVCQTNSVNIEVRQQLNSITSFIDASMIYGSSTETADTLRKKDDGSGQMIMSLNGFLPFKKGTLTPPLSFCKDFGGCFEAGDARVNEQVALASMHTLWIREHNRIARRLKYLNRHWSGERIYLEARKVVAAQIQHITYEEYLPKVLGKDALPKYTGYNSNIDPSISNIFATAAFRFGHSLVQPMFSRLNANFDKLFPDLPLVHAFFNNTLLLQEGIEPFLLGMIGNISSEVDRNIAHGLARGLFQRPGATQGFDLAALNIQRGRDHGLPGYGRWREFCKLPKAYFFEDLSGEMKSNLTRTVLRTLYQDQLEYADPFVVGLAEDHVKGAIVGPLFHCIIKDQFIRLRDGDRFFYKNDVMFADDQLQEIKKASLSSVMCNNLNGIVSIQPDVFRAFDSRGHNRKVCNEIPVINLNAWKEFDIEETKEWTGWHETIRFPTGTWSIQLGMCKNKTIVDIECRSMDNKVYTELKENAKCVIPLGVYCRNEEISDGSCSNYKMRMLCYQSPSQAPQNEEPIVRTGYPKVVKPASSDCNVGVHNNDYAMMFTTQDESVIEDPYQTSRKQEYLHIGKNRQYKKRLLMKFELNRIQRTHAVHSATLQMFYVGHSRSTYSKRRNGSSYIEAYLITSTNWNSTNVTSRVPWMTDYLYVGKDTEARRLEIVEIVDEEPQWLQLNLYKAVYDWRLSSTKSKENFGIMLMMINDDDENTGIVRIASSEHDNFAVRPRLLICLSSSAW